MRFEATILFRIIAHNIISFNQIYATKILLEATKNHDIIAQLQGTTY